MSEIWKPIPGYPGSEASDQGRIKSHRGVVLKSWLSAKYPTVSVRNERGQRKHVHVHRLVLMAHIGVPQSPMDGCHNNGIRTDNRLPNLRWDTRAGNLSDQKIHGTNVNSNKTHCPHGHEYTPENTYILRGRCRSCVTCAKAASMVSYRKRKAAA